MRHLASLSVLSVSLLVLPPAPRSAAGTPGPRPEARAEELVFASGDVSLAGTLLLPAGEGPFPGAVIVHGSGASDRSNAWTSAWAEALVERGIAVLHPDKRGSGKSGGDWRTASFEVLAGDALAGLEALRAHPSIDGERAGLIGFSQGGDVVPVAAARSRSASFVVDVSGSVVPILEQIGDELRSMGRREGLTPGEQERVLSIHELGARFALTGEGWDEYAAALAEARAGRAGGTEVVAGFPDAPDAPTWDFVRAVGDFDPAPYWREVAVPALFLFGGRDENVDVAKSVRILAEEWAGPTYGLLLFRNNGHALFRADAADLMARWIRDGGVD